MRRDLIDPTIAAYSGRTIKLIGDGSLVDFWRVVDAVTCALKVQKFDPRARAATARAAADPVRDKLPISLIKLENCGSEASRTSPVRSRSQHNRRRARPRSDRGARRCDAGPVVTYRLAARERSRAFTLSRIDAARIFFGRDAPIAEAIDRLHAFGATAATRLLVIPEPPGGKSSFLRAGPGNGNDLRSHEFTAG